MTRPAPEFQPAYHCLERARRRPRSRDSAPTRRRIITFESLESRSMLNGQSAAIVHPAIPPDAAAGSAAPSDTSASVGLNPASIHRAHSFNQVSSTGFGQSFSANTIPPEVLGIYVSGTTWNSSFFTYLQTSGLGSAQLGYRLLAGANQLAPLPWTDITTLSVVFSQDVSIDAAAAGLALLGSPDLPPPPLLAKATFAYDAASHTAQWTFGSPLAVDKYLLSIPSAAVTNSLGSALDGEWTNAGASAPGSQFPSGDGVAGGDFNFRFNLLSGDVDQTGTVSGADVNGIRDHLLEDTGSAAYSPFADLDGDGAITGSDGALLRMNWLQSLPTTDPTVPTASITAVTPSPRNSAVAQMQFTFSEAVSGVTLAALSLTDNGGANLLTSAQTLTTSDNITYTLGNLSSLTGGSGSYTLTLNAANSGITDSAGNALAVSATSNFVIDVTAPTVTITAVTPNLSNSAVAQMQLVFSEAVSGVTLSSLSLTNNGGANLLTSAQTLTTSDNVTYTLGNLSSLTSGSGSYTLTLTAAGSGITDLAGNALAAGATTSFIVDTIAPTVAITAVSPSPRNSAVSQMQLVFSEAVSGVTLSSLSLTTNGGANLLTAAQTLTTSDYITYTLGNLASLTGVSGTYTLTLTAAGSGITDSAGNAVTGDATSSFVVDATAPTASITAVTPSPRNSAVSQMQFVFSEAVSGVTLAALSLTDNGGADLLTSAQTLTTSDNATYTLGNLSSLTGGSGSYTLTLNAANSGITDAAGNTLAVNATSSFVIDVTAPTVTITAVTPNPRTSSVSQMQFVFSEAVSGVTLSALSLTVNGGANLLTSAQTLTTTDYITYTLGNLSSPTGASGNYTLTVTAAGSGITDAVGNALAGNATSSFVINLPQWTPGPTKFLPSASSYAVDSLATAVSEQVVTTTGGNVLVVLGTAGTDTIILSESGTSITVATSTGNQTFAGSFVGIAVYGFGGGDTIRLDHTIAASITSVVYGGAGGNTISDPGPDTAYLFAGSGADTLISIGGGADHLAGGAGLDSFWYDSSDTLTGTTAAETTAKSIHAVTAFIQPTTDPTQAVSLEVAGQDIVDPVSAYGYTNNFVNQPLWSGTPQFNDTRQGALDDCYFLAGLSALAETDPGLIQQSIVALGDGSYAVRFYRGSTASYYRIDGQLPTSGGSPAYDQLTPNGALWVALEEKAFAQFRSGQNSYSSLAFGWMDEAYTAITGASYSMQYTTSSTANALAQSMANSLAAGHAVTAGSNNPSSAPIVSSHAYDVQAVTDVNGTWYVTVYNPWGFDGASWDSNPNDGLLQLTASQFQTCFQVVETCTA
jgi:uncharacterized protein YaiE (UPF0345 family)